MNHDPRTRWPRLVAAVARYMVGPVVRPDDLADAAEAVGEYHFCRSLAPEHRLVPEADVRALRSSIEHAVEHRHEFTEEV